MGVDFFWRRAEPELLGGDLFDLVPYWLDDGFAELWAAGFIVGVEDTCGLIVTLLRLADLRADILPDDMDTDTPGVLMPDEVAAAASVLARVETATLVRRFRTELVDYSERADIRGVFDDQRAEDLADDVTELTKLFASAAAAGQAVIVTVVA